MSMPMVPPSMTGAPIGIADDRMKNALPVANQAWPPPQFDPVAYQHRIWNAWWTGDRQILSWVYYSLGANSPAGRAFFASTGEPGTGVPKPGQYRGGLLGSIEYSFWGEEVTPGEKRTRLHVPIAADISETSASLLFAKPPQFKTTLEGGAAEVNQAWFDSLVDDHMHKRLNEAAEMGSALGGVFLRIVWDTAVSPQPWIQPVDADLVIPEFSYDKLVAATFWRVIADTGDEVTRHLEKHVPSQNTIQHGVYEGNQAELGDPVPLAGFPEFARQLSGGQGDTLELPDLPFDASTVIYVPNKTPNKIWRELGPAAAPLGRSDYAGIEPLMDQLDECYSSWMRDVQLAVSRLIVPQEYLEDIGKGKGAAFVPDKRVYTPLNMLHDQGAGAAQITMNQFKIRWEEHQQTCKDLANRIVQEAGFSPQTFGDYQGQAPTATEIEARSLISNMTREKKITLWRPALQDAIYSLMCVAKLYFGATGLTPERPDIEFGKKAIPDEFQLAQTVGALAAAQAASKETLVKMAHPEWDQAEVDVEVKKIFEEMGTELAAHTKVTMAAPVGATLQDDVAALTAVTPVPGIAADEAETPGEPDEE